MRGPRIIGYRRDGSPIAEVAGGDGRPVDPIALAEATRRAYDDLTLASGGGLPLHPGEGQPGSRAGDGRSLGQTLVESEQYKQWMRQFPEGGPSPGTPATSAPVGVRSPAVDAGDRFRALLTSASASVGGLVPPQFLGLMDPGIPRVLTLRTLVTSIPVTSDAPEYVRESARVEAAAPVAEANQLGHTGDETATKSEGALTFTVERVDIRTIAEWIPATKRIVSDAPGLRAYVDQFLSDDLQTELEDQMVAGSGAGEDFLGILNDPGIQSTGSAGDGLNALDRIRRAKRLVRVGARTQATAVVLNPEDSEMVDTLKAAGDGHYFIPGGPYGATDLPRVWGIAQVESEGVPAGTAIVADFRRAVLFDRESTTITVGTAGDDFIRNIVRVLGELRAGFALVRPAAFVAVDLAAVA